MSPAVLRAPCFSSFRPRLWPSCLERVAPNVPVGWTGPPRLGDRSGAGSTQAGQRTLGTVSERPQEPPSRTVIKSGRWPGTLANTDRLREMLALGDVALPTRPVDEGSRQCTDEHSSALARVGWSPLGPWSRDNRSQRSTVLAFSWVAPPRSFNDPDRFIRERPLSAARIGRFGCAP